jgi:hypothetical protein
MVSDSLIPIPRKMSPFFRRINFALVLLFCSSGLFSQGNLQFNQVILLEWTATVPPNGAGVYAAFGANPFVVPAGKVWKIESMNISLNRVNLPSATFNDPQFILNGTNSFEPPMLYINNTVVHVNGEAGSPGLTKPQIIWLPPGNYQYVMGARPSSSLSQEFSAFVTAIEFNVVP